MRYILLYPDTHEHLGLFDDLKSVPDVELVTAGLKYTDNIVLKQIRRVHLSRLINRYLPLPFRFVWYRGYLPVTDRDKEYCFMVMDGALAAVSVRKLNRIFRQPNVRGVLLLINSLNAQSASMLESRGKFKKVRWDAVYSFDPRDVRRYGLKPLGSCYYSYHEPEKILDKFPDEKLSEVYFAGGLKGNRENLIIGVFEILKQNKIRVNFNLAVSGVRRFKPCPYSEEINYYTGGWLPYEKVLAGVLKSEVILEVLQCGQQGPSLRYYEAVCYNKKLLSNNPSLAGLPYYDSRYMKIFSDPSDIDLDWIRRDLDVDYHYKFDFSPVHLPGRVSGEYHD